MKHVTVLYVYIYICMHERMKTLYGAIYKCVCVCFIESLDWVSLSEL